MNSLSLPITAAAVPITQHAQKRMQMRKVSSQNVLDVLDYGRTFFSRKAVFLVIGRKEISRYRNKIDLEQLNGLHVVCSHGGHVITVYRNPDFRSKDYPNGPRRRRRNRRAP